ncbi:MAG: hypothetical protein ACR2J8_12695, partial [Thermomicrobiales bacterium]
MSATADQDARFVMMDTPAVTIATTAVSSSTAPMEAETARWSQSTSKAGSAGGSHPPWLFGQSAQPVPVCARERPPSTIRA